MLVIQVLGSFELFYEGERVALQPGSAAHTLLALLLLHHDNRVSRSYLAGQIWGDFSENAARRKLSDALYQLRKYLPAGRLNTDRASITLTLAENDKCDLLELERFLDTPDMLPPAILLQVTDPRLFPELDYEWALLAREALRIRYLDRLEREALQARASGDLNDALALLRHLCHLEPLRESGQRALLELLISMNRLSEAVELYKQLCACLETELGIAPAPETERIYRALLRRLNTDTTPERFSLPQELPLVGRDEERSCILRYLLEYSDEGGYRHTKPRIILLEGSPGIGKSRLLAAIADDARWRNWQVAEGKPVFGVYALENALRAILTPLRIEEIAHHIDPVWLARLLPIFPELARWLPDLPETTPLEGEAARIQRREAMYRLLTALTAYAPLLLLLDDIHLAVTEELRQLEALAAAPLSIPLAVIISYRPGAIRDDAPRWRALQALDAATGKSRLSLASLPMVEVNCLLCQLLGAVTPPIVEKFYALTSGHPLFMREALAVLAERDVFQPQNDGTWRLDATQLETIQLPSVTSAIDERISRLSDAETEMLIYSSLYEGELSPSLLTALTGYASDEVLRGARNLVKRQFWGEGKSGYRCAHDLIRQTARDTLAAAERQKRHTVLFSALRVSDASPITLSYHAYASGLWNEAVPLLARTGAEVRARGDFNAAENYFSKALAILDEMPQSTSCAALSANEQRKWRIWLLFERQQLWSWLGQPENRADDLNELDGLLAPVGLARLRWQSARAEWLAARGEVRAARELAETTLDKLAALPLKTDADLISRLIMKLHLLIAKLTTWSDIQVAAEHNRAAGDLAKAYGAIEAQVQALNNLAVFDHFRGDFPAAKAQYEKTRHLAEEYGLTMRALLALSNLAAVEQALGNEAAAIDAYEQVIDGYERHAAVDPFDLDNLAYLYIWTGAFDRAERVLQRAHALWQERHDAVGIGMNLSRSGLLALERLRPARACSLLHEAVRIGEEHQDGRITCYAYVWLGLYYLEEGDYRQAELMLSRAVAALERMGVNFLNALVFSLLANAAARRGDYVEAEGKIAQAEAELPHVFHAFRAHYYIGLAVQTLNQIAPAAEHFQIARDILHSKAAELPPDLAAAFMAAPRNRRIYWAARRRSANGGIVTLPYSGAPTGRALKPCETVPVLWEMLPPDGETDVVALRRARLRALVEQTIAQEAYPTIEALAQFLGVSPATISRDLAALREKGEVLPTRGT